MSAKETKAIVHHWFRVRLTMLVAIGISFIVGVWLVVAWRRTSRRSVSLKANTSPTSWVG